MGGDNYRFKETLWTQIIKAKDKSETGYTKAISYLISAYWKPVYFYIRRKGYDVENSKDLTQSFFTVFLEKEFLQSVDKGKGKFRTFILASLNHFLSKEREKAAAQKRGGGKLPLALDFSSAESEISFEPHDKSTPEKEFLQDWARSILKHALENLRAEFEQKSRKVYMDIFDSFLSSTAEEKSIGYAETAKKFNISEMDVKNYLHRIKRRYRELIEDEIKKYVSEPEEIKEELQELFSIFSDNF